MGTVGDRSTMPLQKVRIIMAKSIRNLIIPRPEGLQTSITIDAREFERIKKNSFTKKLSLEDQERQKEKELEVKMERMKRRQEMKRIDLQRQQRNQFSEVEEEAGKNAAAIMSIATEKMQEADDNVKAFNKMINTAKCNAILDAQVEEKKKIAQLVVDEEKVLDHCSEAARQKAIMEMEKEEEMAKARRMEVAADIRRQINERELQKILELDHKEQENIQMRKVYDRMMAEDMKELKRKDIRKKEYLEATNKANQELQAMRRKQIENDKMEDLRIWEFQKKKAEREMAAEMEEDRKKKEKEITIGKLLAMQEQCLDERAEKQAMQARREQEEKEREWLQKEYERATFLKKRDHDMQVARQKQMEWKENMGNQQAVLDKTEFDNILKYQRKQMEKEKRIQEEEYARNISIARDIREQMKAKEQDKIRRRQVFYEEAEQEKEYARSYRQKLREIKEKKFNELKKVGIPEKYLKTLERDLRAMKKIEENVNHS